MSPPAVPVDPELTDVLDMIRGAIPATGLTLETLPTLRAAFAYTPTDVELDPAGAWDIWTEAAPGLDGAPRVELVVCTPKVKDTALPVVYYAHGGGLVAGHARSNLGDVLALAAAADAAVVSVEYRLAPETPFPGAFEDCAAGLQWLRAFGPDHGLDGGRVILAGTSAGAGLMAALSLHLRDAGGDEAIGQLLMAPMLDDRGATKSAKQMEGTGVWDRVSNNTAWRAYLNDLDDGDVSSYAAPARDDDLGRLPATFLDCGDAETFRDEIVDFASRIWSAGGNAELHVWPGGFHGFDAMVPDASVSKAAKESRSRWLQRVLHTSTPTLT